MTSLDRVEGALVDDSKAVLVKYKSNSELSPQNWTVNGNTQNNNIKNLSNGIDKFSIDRNGYVKDSTPLPGSIPEPTVSPSSKPAVLQPQPARPKASVLTRKELVDKIKKQVFDDPYIPKHQNGPDCVIQTEKLKVWNEEGAVRLRMGTSGLGAQAPFSLITLLSNIAKSHPQSPAMGVKRNGKWIMWNYTEYLRDVRLAAKGFIKLGLLPFHGVGIIGFNSPEWVIANLGAIFAGGFSAGIYTTNSADSCRHCLEDSKANVVVVEDDKQLEKILEIKHKLPHIRHIIQYLGEPKHPDILTWSDLLEIGKTVPDSVLERRIKGIAVNQCCTLIYTSGTTGNSKGVMLSHDNLVFISAVMVETCQVQIGNESIVSYLPMSHVAAQMHDLYIGMYAAGTIYFAQPDAMKGTLKDTILDVKPTRFLGVPRVWEKMQATLVEREKTMGFVSKKLFNYARRVGAELARMRNAGSTSLPFGYTIANIIYKKVHKAIGFENIRTFICGAAPLAKEIVEYYHSLNIPIQEMYGMSETSAPHTANFIYRTKLGTVGRTIPNLETKLFDKAENGDGEICMRGRNIFMGYLNLEDKTHEAIDDEGWLHSGDIGRFDEDQYLKITGRIKELLITAGGENVAPVPIEENIKRELPCISNAMVIGDRRKFLSVILSFKTLIDVETMLPTHQLLPAATDWLKAQGCRATTVTEVLDGKNDQVMEAIQKGIDRANKCAASNAQRVQKWVVIPQDFSIPGGELGPTLKVKRPVVYEKYADVIERLYPPE